MRPSAIQFVFNHRVSLQEAEMSLHLAMFAVEGLIGRVRVCLDAKYHLDESKRAIVIATRRHAGLLIARVFTGLLMREFGEEAFRVKRVNQLAQHKPQEVRV